MLVNVNTRDDGSLKDSLRNAQASGELAIQLVSFAQAEAMNACAAILPHEVSEFAHCAIASQPCARIDVPGVGDKALAPEFEAVAADGRLVADTIDRGDVAAVGHGVAALMVSQAPCWLTPYRLFAGVPADGGRVDEELAP